MYGHFKCQDAVYGFELEIALQWVVSGGVEGGEYLMVDSPVKKVFGNKGKLVSEGALKKDFACTPGREYRAWVFGRFWYKNKYTPWSATTIDGRLMECVKVDVELPPGS